MMCIEGHIEDEDPTQMVGQKSRGSVCRERGGGGWLPGHELSAAEDVWRAGPPGHFHYHAVSLWGCEPTGGSMFHGPDTLLNVSV